MHVQCTCVREYPLFQFLDFRVAPSLDSHVKMPTLWLALLVSGQQGGSRTAWKNSSPVYELSSPVMSFTGCLFLLKSRTSHRVSLGQSWIGGDSCYCHSPGSSWPLGFKACSGQNFYVDSDHWHPLVCFQHFPTAPLPEGATWTADSLVSLQVEPCTA